jgi:hypothetical protein
VVVMTQVIGEVHRNSRTSPLYTMDLGQESSTPLTNVLLNDERIISTTVMGTKTWIVVPLRDGMLGPIWEYNRFDYILQILTLDSHVDMTWEIFQICCREARAAKS